MTRVVVVGDLVTDVLVAAAGGIAFGSDTDATITQRGGGAGANTACWLAECGVDAALIARVGNDEAGHARTSELLGAGVEALVAVDQQVPTGTVVVVVGADGERTMLTDRGASARLGADDLPAQAFLDAAHLHLSGYLFFDPTCREAALEALTRARTAGITVSVDAASAAPLARCGPQAFLDCFGGADLLLANADEARVLSGSEKVRSAARALSGRFGAVVVKAGAAGAVWAARDTEHTCPARAACVLDTTGAGDAFAALAARAVATRGGRPTGR